MQFYIKLYLMIRWTYMKFYNLHSNFPRSTFIRWCARCFRDVFHGYERFCVKREYIIFEPYLIDKAIAVSETRLKTLQESNAPKAFIEQEKQILVKRKWIKHQGYESMDEWYNIDPRHHQ